MGLIRVSSESSFCWMFVTAKGDSGSDHRAKEAVRRHH
jgi:hypothetical protein